MRILRGGGYRRTGVPKKSGTPVSVGRPVRHTLVVGSLLPLLLRAGAPGAAGVAVWLVVGLIAWGLHRVRRLTHLHRW